MANKITLKAQDGSTVEFYDEIKAQGGVKDVLYGQDVCRGFLPKANKR